MDSELSLNILMAYKGKSPPKNPKHRPQRTNAAQAAVRQDIADSVTASGVPATVEEYTRLRDQGGRLLPKLSPDQIEWALERIGSGDAMRNICEDLSITPASLYSRAYQDPAFAERFRTAIEIGQHARLDRAERMILGEDGYTTGSIERDKAYLDFAKWMASKLNRGAFGERSPLAGSNIIIQLPDSTDFS